MIDSIDVVGSKGASLSDDGKSMIEVLAGLGVQGQAERASYLLPKPVPYVCFDVNSTEAVDDVEELGRCCGNDALSVQSAWHSLESREGRDG